MVRPPCAKSRARHVPADASFAKRPIGDPRGEGVGRIMLVRTNGVCVVVLGLPTHHPAKKEQSSKAACAKRRDISGNLRARRKHRQGRRGVGTRVLLRYMYKYYWVFKSALLFSTKLESGTKRLRRLFRALPLPSSSPRGGRQASKGVTANGVHMDFSLQIQIHTQPDTHTRTQTQTATSTATATGYMLRNIYSLSLHLVICKLGRHM